jgi:hypothetical protein
MSEPRLAASMTASAIVQTSYSADMMRAKTADAAASKYASDSAPPSGYRKYASLRSFETTFSLVSCSPSGSETGPVTCSRRESAIGSMETTTSGVTPIVRCQLAEMIDAAVGKSGRLVAALRLSRKIES